MEILAVSDMVHPEVYNERITDRFGKVELVLSCGDLPFYYLEYIVSMLNVPLLYVLGNHDRPLVTEAGEVPAPQGCIDVNKRVVGQKGLLVGGLEGSIRYRPGGQHQYTEREMRWMVRRIAPRLYWNRITRGRGIDVLITHSPPWGIHDQEDPAHRGFAALLAFMRRFRPRYLIHGHTYPKPGAPWRARYLDTEVIHVHGYRVLEVEVGEG